MKPAKTGKQQANPGQFQPGQSGNPAGRKAGSRNRATIVAIELLDGQAEELTRECITWALGGCRVCMKLLIERLIPPRKDRPINVKLPKMTGPDDIPAALGAILEAVAGGKITPGEGRELAGIVASYRRGVNVEPPDAWKEPPDLSDLTTEELKLAVNLGVKLAGSKEVL